MTQNGEKKWEMVKHIQSDVCLARVEVLAKSPATDHCPFLMFIGIL